MSDSHSIPVEAGLFSVEKRSDRTAGEKLRIDRTKEKDGNTKTKQKDQELNRRQNTRDEERRTTPDNSESDVVREQSDNIYSPDGTPPSGCRFCERTSNGGEKSSQGGRMTDEENPKMALDYAGSKTLTRLKVELISKLNTQCPPQRPADVKGPSRSPIKDPHKVLVPLEEPAETMQESGSGRGSAGDAGVNAARNARTAEGVAIEVLGTAARPSMDETWKGFWGGIGQCE
ncbi:hypothetical protein BDN72DRAFT_863159 [Pluteus cervinus]|uniref:Uncharacterized protein n=1 Tax=Pluteus cervinus TaxID=181527 RepID=A0ACD3A9D2_9AGAR|nr:hypothetical protein BDN72DRAFT_863159 [Pluteus cervinus]